MAIAAGKMFTRDMRQAYVSADLRLIREIYLIPPKELNIDENILWELERSLHGLPESDKLWFERYISHYQDTPKLTSSEIDPCLLYRHKHGVELDGMVCLQVDDTIGAWSPDF